MAMTNTEQNSLFQAVKTVGEGQAMLLRVQDGVNEYILCKLVPIQVMTPAQATAYAALYSVTIASA